MEQFLDSTKVGVLMECPRKFWYQFRMNRWPKEPSLGMEFGRVLHAARDVWYEERDVEKAKRKVMELWQPFEGKDESGVYTIAKGEEVIGAYVRQFGDEPWEHTQGEALIEFEVDGQKVVGLVDGVGLYCGEMAFQEFKTTRSPWFFCSRPNFQITTYAVGLSMIHKVPIRRAVVTIAGLFKGSVNGEMAGKKGEPPRSIFTREIVDLEDWDFEEWKNDLRAFRKEIQFYEEMNYWPKHTRSCGAFGTCPYIGVCSMPESMVEFMLEANFDRRIWDPRLERR